MASMISGKMQRAIGCNSAGHCPHLAHVRFMSRQAAATTQQPSLVGTSRMPSIGMSNQRRTAVVSQALPNTVFGAATGVVLCMYTLMSFAPNTKLTRQLAESPLLDLVLLGLYAAAMWHAWQQGLLQQVAAAVHANFPAPDIVSLSALAKSQAFTVVCWVHLLMLDLFMARAVLLDGLKSMVATSHSVLLCFMCGPTGLLTHIITKVMFGKGPSKPLVA